MAPCLREPFFLTLLTLSSGLIPSPMPLIIPMTGETGIFIYRIWMAGTAGGMAMIDAIPAFPYSRFRMRQVEGGRAPRGGAVARFARCAKRSGVECWIFMAIDAGGWRPCKLPVDVTFLAGDLLMRTCQREVGLIVVEGDIIPPEGRVAGRTILSKFATMFIVLFMA